MKKRILVTGGAGFIGSTVSEYLLSLGYEVVILDSFVRKGVEHNVLRLREAEVIRGDIRFSYDLRRVGKVDGIIHTAANPAIKLSIMHPKLDFETNALGTINVLEYARLLGGIPVIYCSTNKVYSGNIVNAIRIKALNKRYVYAESSFSGIRPDCPVDGNDHSCYGVSKLSGDLYCQEYAKNMGVPTVVNRMSCIGGKWQMGVEEQGWVAWFVFAAIVGCPLNIYGSGKQVRDVLDAEDLARLFEMQLSRIGSFSGNVFNVGGGIDNTLSLLECIEYLEEKTGKQIPLKFHPKRIADHDIYVSDISKLKDVWQPKTSPTALIDKIYAWAYEHREILDMYKEGICQTLQEKN